MKTLAERMTHLGIVEDDLKESFVLGSGSGGQKVNKTASCVQLVHAPSGIVIKNQVSRSREANRIAAREELCTRLEATRAKERQDLVDEREKNRRRTRQKSRRQKARMVDAKKKHGRKKQNRRKPGRDD